MRISDWSSDVCSSDLNANPVSRQERVASLDQWYGDLEALPRRQRLWRLAAIPAIEVQDGVGHPLRRSVGGDVAQSDREEGRRLIAIELQLELRRHISEERRVGKECVRKCKTRWE